MKKILLYLAIAIGMIVVPTSAFTQCANGTNSGLLPIMLCQADNSTTTTYNLGAWQNGQYRLVHVISGFQYRFTTCGASYDTQLTIRNNTNGDVLAYNDDNASGTNDCGGGLQSALGWTATFTGLVRVQLNQYNCATNTTTATVYAKVVNGGNNIDNPNAAGSNQWVGHVYAAQNLTQYIGYYIEPETFDQSFGGGSTGCSSVDLQSQGIVRAKVDIETFSVRYRMTKDFASGYYTFTIGSDDGSRLSVNNGGSWIINQWVDQGYTTASATVYLSGTNTLLLDYYENGGGNRVSFNYTYQYAACGYTGPSNIQTSNGGNNPAGSLGCSPSWSSNFCAGSGTYTNVDLTNGVGYSIENQPSAAGCGTNMPTAFISVLKAGNQFCGAWSSVSGPSSNTLTFTADYTGPHRITVSENFTSDNDCGPCKRHTFSGQSAVLRYRQNTTVSVSPSIAGNLCSNGTKTITANLGGAHNNPTISWNLSGIGTLSGSGNSRTYTAPASGSGSVTITATVGVCSASHTFNVNESPAQPTFTASQNPACSGSYYTYTVSPASGGPLTYAWTYSGTQAGLSGGTSSTVNFAPITAGTLTVTPSANGCPGPSRTLGITVDQPSVGGTLSSNQTICAGEVPLALGLTGQTGSVVRWDVGVFPSSWSAIPASAGLTTYSPGQIFEETMYMVTVKNGVCPQVTSNGITITTPPMGTDEAFNGESASCPVSVNGFIHLRETGLGRIIASINSGGQNLGTVTATAYVAGAPIPVQACGTTQPWYITDVLGRHWVISATNPPASPVTVRLYFDASELTALQSSSTTNQNPNDDVNGITWLDLSRYSNTVNVDSNPLNNCASGSSTVHLQTASGTTNTTGMGLGSINAQGRYVEYQIPGFSEFWLSGTNNVSPLPIVLQSFTATCTDHQVILEWKTATEINNEKFIIERSADLQDWQQVAIIPGAGNSNQELIYTAVDDRPIGTSYYRLTQVDYDGQFETFTNQIVSIVCDPATSASVLVVPNPNQGTFAVVAQLPNDEQGVIYIHDIFGKLVTQSNTFNGIGKPVNHSFSERLAPGTYIVTLRGERTLLTWKMIVQ